MATPLPPPIPRPQQVEEIHVARFSRGMTRILEDFRILFIVFLVCILIAVAWGAWFLISQDRGTTALLYIPAVLVVCHYVQRLARSRP